MNLRELVDFFASVDNEMRLSLLLDYSQKQPPLDQFHTARKDSGLFNVPECQTPVYLSLEKNSDNTVAITTFVPEESPTVRGFVTALSSSLQGETLENIRDIPQTLLHEMGITQVLSSLRTRGMEGVLYRLRTKAILYLEDSESTE